MDIHDMHRHRPIALTAAMLTVSASLACGAADLEEWSGTELRTRCLAYLESPQSREGQSCNAYIRGFFAGSHKIILRSKEVERKRSESFAERATRTRLGHLRAPRPTYCIDIESSFLEFVNQLLAYAPKHLVAEDSSASAVLYGVLSRHYRCRP